MKQKALSLLLTLCMALALLPGTVRAEDDDIAYPVTGGNIYFDMATGAITGCDFEVTEAAIPPEINGIPVTSIDGFAFWKCDNLISVTIPYGVASIGMNAFQTCKGLTSVTIPGSVTSIESSAFWACTSLTSVDIPEGVETIGEGAFQSCESLTSVTIPNSVTSIGDMAFANCGSLTSINVASGNANYVSIDGVLFNSDQTLLYTYPAGKTSTSYSIPASVTSIGSSAFSESSNLTSVTIPNSVTSISGYAFTYCSSLASMDIPDSVTSIGEFAFAACSSLTSVTIPDSVTSIENNTFTDCSSLTSVQIPDSVTSIGHDAFSNCISLTGVIIPNGVTSIPMDTFYGCGGLTSVCIPGSVTDIRGYAFKDCSSLTDVYYAGSKTDWAKITIGNEGNDPLSSATVHYNSTGPTSTPSTPATNAVLSPQKLSVDGSSVDCEKYNIDGSNYFKLRDLAYLLNGTGSQFEVGYDAGTSTVTITTGAAYTPNNTELVTGVDNSRTAQPSAQTIQIDGTVRSDLTVYNIGGSNFFKLRDLGTALGFAVDFDAASNTAVVTTK